MKILGSRQVFAPPKDGRLRDARLPESVLTTRERAAANRNYINAFVWKPALQQTAVPATRENGMHVLRHYFASALLEDGVSIKALAEYLGHADAGFTLRTYMMPASEDRMRKAVDRALGATADGFSRALDVPSGGG